MESSGVRRRPDARPEALPGPPPPRRPGRLRGHVRELADRARRRGPVVRPRPPLRAGRRPAGRPGRRPDRSPRRRSGSTPDSPTGRASAAAARSAIRGADATERARRDPDGDRGLQVPRSTRPARGLGVRSGRATREVAIEGRRVTIGRADDNDLVVRDGRVSRYHGRSRAARRAGLHRPRQHERVAGQRRPGRRGGARRGGSDRDRRHGLVVEVDGAARLMDGFRSSSGAPAALPRAALSVPFAVVRVLLRDLRAAAREPGRARPAGRHRVAVRRSGGRPSFRWTRSRRWAATSTTRSSSRTRSPRRARRPDVPRAELVRRGPRQHQRHVRQRQPVGRPPLGFGDELQVGQVRFRLERARR